MANQGHIEIYIYFDGNAEEALNFYKELFKGEVTYIQYWKDIPPIEEGGGMMPEMSPDSLLHSSLKMGDSTIMMSDNPFMNTSFGDSVNINWSHSDKEEVRRVWDGFVAAGATVNMPLEFSFFSELFGSLTDHFGINWQIMLWDDEA